MESSFIDNRPSIRIPPSNIQDSTAGTYSKHPTVTRCKMDEVPLGADSGKNGNCFSSRSLVLKTCYTTLTWASFTQVRRLRMLRQCRRMPESTKGIQPLRCRSQVARVDGLCCACPPTLAFLVRCKYYPFIFFLRVKAKTKAKCGIALKKPDSESDDSAKGKRK